jgi:microcystin-dependent protein
MADPFVAEIRAFGFDFAPTGWALCDGQLLPLSQNTALFSLVGTFYGGDGKSTFALPDLQGNAPMHQGQGQGLSQRFLGEEAGTQFVTLLQSEIPLHSHSLGTSSEVAVAREPAPNLRLARGQAISMYGPNNGATTTMSPNSLAVTGSSLPHNNMQPYLVLSFCIALQGVFPPRQ